MKLTKVTLQDIAKNLGFSVSTVSRALNDKPEISEAVKTEIRMKALELGYDLKSIRRKHEKRDPSSSLIICVVITRDNFLDENFYRKIIREIEQELHRNKIDMILSIIDPDNNDAISHMLKKSKPNGVLLFGIVPNKNITEAAFSGVPVVLVDTPKTRTYKVDRVTINNYLGCYEAVAYVMQQGHRRISFLGDVKFSDNMEERYNGCKDCVKRNNGIWVEADGIVRLETSGQVIMDEMKLQSLLKSDTAPSAVVCANDKTAFKLYESLQNLGLSVPEDLSILGFDNSDRCEKVSPPLTSVHVPKVEMGKEAVRMILDRIENSDKSTASLRLDTELIKRESVKKLKGEG